MDEKKITALMKTLELSRDEAIELMKADEEVDRMEQKQVNNDLSADQKKVVKQMKNVSRAPTIYKWEKKRERKPNEPKRELINAIEEMLSNSDIQADNVVITNSERQIDFTFNGIRYRVVLSAPRK